MLPKIYDHTTNILDLDAAAKEPFRGGKPAGITIHYTADGSIEAATRALKTKGLGYHIIIDRDGKVYQLTSLDRSCWHAGKAVWNGVSPNREHVSVALVSWGYLDETEVGYYKSYAGTIVPPAEVHYRPDNVTGHVMAWHLVNDVQMHQLRLFLDWMIGHGISPKNICGHDECALPPGRKSDPGGALPLSMSELRAALIAAGRIS